MEENKRKGRKRWVRRMGIAAAGLMVLVVLAGGVVWWKIRSIDSADILARQEAKKNQTGSTESGSDPLVENILKNPLEKANQYTNKKIDVQDALDAASILTKAGLSLKEISYLTGQADMNLSNTEKQRIRDLLLTKLNKDDISALRAITEPYGKKLVILDPDYPIELVGVYDETERQKIISAIHNNQQSSTPPSGGSASVSPGSSPEKQRDSGGSTDGAAGSSGSAQGTEPLNKGGANGGQSQPGTPASTPASYQGDSDSGTKAAKALIQGKYKPGLDKLQAGCQQKVGELTGAIVQTIQSSKSQGKGVPIDQIQSSYLGKVSAAESQCDAEFNTILSAAEKEYQAAGYDPAELESWRSQYQSSKDASKEKALAQIGKLMN